MATDTPSRNPDGVNREKSTTSPIAECPRAIVLYPVRFALKNDTLRDIATGKQKTVLHAKSIQSADLHELRRLRQGYVYIYTIPVANASDCTGEKDLGVWHLYHYNTAPNDSNAETQVDNEKAMPFQFQKYEWIFPGNNEVKWTPTSSHTTIPISKHISSVWIAYSEFRWPYKLFKEMENNDTVRKQFMQQVIIGKNEDSREGDFTTSIRHLSNKVADFTETAKKQGKDNPVDYSNFLRYTAVGYNEKDPMLEYDFSDGNGVIVALQDTIGEILDISAVHGGYFRHREEVFSIYEYPLKTAIFAQQIEISIVNQKYRNDDVASSIRRWWDNVEKDDPTIWLDSYKLPPDSPLNNELISDFAERLGINPSELKAKRLMDKFVEASQKADAVMKNLVNTQWALINNKDRQDLTPRLRALMNYVIEDKVDPDAMVQYLCYVGSQLFQNLNLSPEGQAITDEKLKVLATLDTKANGLKQEVGTAIIQTTLGYFANLVDKKKTLPLCYMDTLIETVSRQLIHQYSLIFTASATGTSTTLSLHARERITQVSQIYRVQLSDFSETQIARQRKALNNLLAKIRQTPGLSVMHAEQHPHQSDSYLKYPNAGSWGHGGAVLLGWAVIFQSTFENKTHYNKIGMLAENRLVVLGQALADNLSATRAFVVGGNVQKMANALHNGMVTLGLRNAPLRNANVVATGAGTAESSLARQLFKRANFIAFVGIGLSTASAVDGYLNDDMAKFTGNLLNATGATALLIAGTEASASGVFLVAGVVLIATGMVASLFEQNELEAWIKQGFWGNSTNYWGGYETGWFESPWLKKRLVFDKLFEGAKTLNLSPQNSQIRKDYAIEMGRLSDFLQPIHIGAGVKGRRTIYIRWHGLHSAADLAKLTLETWWHQSWKSEIPKGGLTPDNIGNFGNPEPCGFRLQFFGTGIAYFEISEAQLNITAIWLPINKLTKALRVKVTAPRTASANGTTKREKIIMLDELN